MQGMLNNQLQSLNAQYKAEIARFSEQDATPRGE